MRWLAVSAWAWEKGEGGGDEEKRKRGILRGRRRKGEKEKGAEKLMVYPLKALGYGN